MSNTDSATSTRKINCPTCQKPVTWSDDSPYRPFCSRQCQLIDFGDWASERNTIPAEEGPENFRLDDLDAPDSDSMGADSEDF